MTPDEWAWAAPVGGPEERAALLALVKVRDGDWVTCRLVDLQILLGNIPERTTRAYITRLIWRGLVEQHRTGGRGGLSLRLAFDRPLDAAQSAAQFAAQTAAHSERLPVAAQNRDQNPLAPPPIPPTPLPPREVVNNAAAGIAQTHTRDGDGGGNGLRSLPTAGRGKYANATPEDREAATRMVLSYYNASGLRWDELTTFVQNRELAIAIDLLRSGATADEAHRFVKWCQEDRARPLPTDMHVFEVGRSRFLHPDDARPGGGRRPAPAAGLTATRSLKDLDA